MRTTLVSGLPSLGLTLSEAQIDTLCRFGQALLEQNQVMNLTAITEPQAVAQLHFLDCLALLNAAEFDGKTLIDVGCGAGFPGVPLAIAAPGCQVTLLDSLGKRTQWLSGLLPKLGIPYSAKIEERMLAGRKVFFVDGDKLAACFDANVGSDTIEEMAKAKPWYAVIRD